MKLLISLAVITGCVVGLAALPPADDPPQFGPWSAPVNLGPVVNLSSNDAGAFITRDGLSLYFSSTREGGFGYLDLWVSQRPSTDAAWGPPRNLGSVINTGSNDTTPAISVDGHWLFYASDRPGGLGGLDLYVSRRHDKRDNFGWQPPVSLGELVNSQWNDRGPSLLDDEATGTYTLYFGSGRRPESDTRYEEIWASTLGPDGKFGRPVTVVELNSDWPDNVPAVRHDGLEIFFSSQRDQPGNTDLFVSTRASTTEPWSTPQNLGPVVNSPVMEFRPAISFDGTALYFHSLNRPGGYGDNDLYVATRTKLKHKD